MLIWGSCNNNKVDVTPGNGSPQDSTNSILTHTDSLNILAKGLTKTWWCRVTRHDWDHTGYDTTFALPDDSLEIVPIDSTHISALGMTLQYRYTNGFSVIEYLSNVASGGRTVDLYYLPSNDSLSVTSGTGGNGGGSSVNYQSK